MTFCFCNDPNHIRCYGILFILRKKYTRFLIINYQLDKLTKIINIEHRSHISHRGKYRKCPRKLCQFRIIPLAPPAIYHRRSKNSHTKPIIRKRSYSLICLPFTIPIKIQWLWHSINANSLFLTSAINNHRGHKDKLPNPSYLCFLRHINSKLCIDFIIHSLLFLRCILSI